MRLVPRTPRNRNLGPTPTWMVILAFIITILVMTGIIDLSIKF